MGNDSNAGKSDSPKRGGAMDIASILAEANSLLQGGEVSADTDDESEFDVSSSLIVNYMRTNESRGLSKN